MAGTKAKTRNRHRLADGTVATTVIVSPGDRLPKGVFVNGWKLDPGALGTGKLYLVIKEDGDNKKR